MLVAGMRKLCRVCLAAVLATALCVLTLVDVPPQLPEPPTVPPPTPEREPPGTRSIVAYSWARRLALDYRPSRQCRDDVVNDIVTIDDAEKIAKSSFFSGSNDFASGNAERDQVRGSINDSERSQKWLETIPRRLFLYSAHLDIRVTGYPSVRVIGVKRETASTLLRTTGTSTTTTTSTTVSGTLYCTIWYTDVDGTTRSFSMEALISDIWLDEWGGSRQDYTGILVTCHLPRTQGLQRVHVGSTSCYQNPSHSLLIRKPPERRKNNVPEISRPASQEGNPENHRQFTLCIKGLDFDEDISERLVAFVELNRILGAGMIFVYVFNVHENVSKILRMYEKSNVVRWFNIELPGDLPNDIEARRDLMARDVWLKRRMELIPYNHCFYENLYTSDFVVPIDIDETIIPVSRSNWPELMENEKIRLGRGFNDFASYSVRNVYFFTELQNKVESQKSRNFHGPEAETMSCDIDSLTCAYLDTIRTSIVSPIGDSVKSFISTERALTVHNHYALKTLNPTTRRAYHLDPRDVLKHHHRMCDERHLDCGLMMDDLCIDETALRYADELKIRMKVSLERVNSID